MMNQAEQEIYETLARLCDRTADHEFENNKCGFGHEGYIVARQLANAIRGRLNYILQEEERKAKNQFKEV